MHSGFIKRNQTSSTILQLKKIKGSIFKGAKRNDVYSESLFLNYSDAKKTGFYINPVYFNCPIEYLQTEKAGNTLEHRNSFKIAKGFLQINNIVELETENILNKGITQHKISFLENLQFSFFNYVNIENFLSEIAKFIRPNFLILSEIKIKQAIYLDYLVKLKNSYSSITTSGQMEIYSLIKNMSDYYEVFFFLIESKGRIELE